MTKARMTAKGLRAAPSTQAARPESDDQPGLRRAGTRNPSATAKAAAMMPKIRPALTARTYRVSRLSAQGWNWRQGSPRRAGHGGRPVGAVIPRTNGSTRREGRLREKATVIVAVPAGTELAKAQTGWSPLGAVSVMRMRDPAR